MRTVAIGDEHGRGKFKKIYNSLKDDKTIELFVCEGDYFDPYFYLDTDEKRKAIVDNFNDIIAIARSDPRVKLLLGNHDLHYIIDCDKSRYNYHLSATIRKLILDNMDIFNLIVMPNDHTIISHAGVTNVWLNECKIKIEDINGLLNRLKEKDEAAQVRLIYDDRDYSGYGESPIQGCTWVRPNGLMSAESFIDGIKTQIVGHTTTQNIDYFIATIGKSYSSNDPVKVSVGEGEDQRDFYFVDTGDEETYLDIDIV